MLLRAWLGVFTEYPELEGIHKEHYVQLLNSAEEN